MSWRPRMAWCPVALAVAVGIAVAGCGTAAPGASATIVGPASSPNLACPSQSPTARLPIGAAQALTVIPVVITGDQPASPGVERLDAAQPLCIRVGVGQRLAITVAARIPPLPAEVRGQALLSAIVVSPPPAGGVPSPGQFTLTFTAVAAGTTAVSYLPATCNMPPGVC